MGPPAQARPVGPPVPHSDLGLKIALGALLLLIILLTLGIVIGVIWQGSSEETPTNDEIEQTE
jgi:hypothetical protein